MWALILDPSHAGSVSQKWDWGTIVDPEQIAMYVCLAVNFSGSALEQAPIHSTGIPRDNSWVGLT